MTSRPTLSICIPTFNRAALLRECLESIEQDTPTHPFEVVVSDNASSDNTLEVLQEFAAKLPLRWAIQERNVGYDRNFDAVVALAEGDYCWMLGSDDCVEPQAIQKLCDGLLTSGADIYQFGYVQGDIDLNRLRNEHPPERVVSNSRDALAQYLSLAPNVSLLFTFISSFAFRRSLWMDRRKLVQSWFDTFYIHVFAIHSALAEGARLAGTQDCLVLARGDNPNEFNSIPGRFISLDARTMQRLADEIYGGDSRIWAALGEAYRRSYPPKALIYTAANGGLHHLEEVRDALIRLGYGRVLLFALRLLGKLNLLRTVKSVLDLRRTALAKLSSKAQ
jgi:abequosyltransferase